MLKIKALDFLYDHCSINHRVQQTFSINCFELILSLCSIPTISLLLVSLNNVTILLIDSKDLNTTNKYKGSFNLHDYSNLKNIRCESIQSVSNIQNIALIIALCTYENMHEYYFKGSFSNKLRISGGATLAITLDIKSYALVHIY